MPEWLQPYLPAGWTGYHLFAVSLGLFLISFIGSIVVIAWAILHIPPDYFVGERPPAGWRQQHPIIRWPLLVSKNLLGVLLVGLGMIMSLPGVPGQGLLTVLMGVMLIDFPGKRNVERWLISRRGVLSAINKWRVRRGREPLRCESSVAGNEPQA